ncbi:MAG: hypothetical protein S4CHLAM45_04040 [Chlamydiales bacterium]|nr:hypothetical protein [Chlamydiales bacterium]MCH9619258.1 hypothetical protein [Chlamydiales bacterium]MCH9622520.1 hypothetical protein [Chlamydiales bacterium]
MSAWDISILCIVAVCALAFVILAGFAIQTLISVTKTTKAVRKRIHAIDPLLHILKRVGRSVDDEVEYLDSYARRFGYKRRGGGYDMLLDAVKWLTIGGSIISKFRKRRK